MDNKTAIKWIAGSFVFFILTQMVFGDYADSDRILPLAFLYALLVGIISFAFSMSDGDYKGREVWATGCYTATTFFLFIGFASIVSAFTPEFFGQLFTKLEDYIGWCVLVGIFIAGLAYRAGKTPKAEDKKESKKKGADDSSEKPRAEKALELLDAVEGKKKAQEEIAKYGKILNEHGLGGGGGKDKKKKPEANAQVGKSPKESDEDEE